MSKAYLFAAIALVAVVSASGSGSGSNAPVGASVSFFMKGEKLTLDLILAAAGDIARDIANAINVENGLPPLPPATANPTMAPMAPKASGSMMSGSAPMASASAGPAPVSGGPAPVSGSDSSAPAPVYRQAELQMASGSAPAAKRLDPSAITITGATQAADKSGWTVHVFIAGPDAAAAVATLKIVAAKPGGLNLPTAAAGKLSGFITTVAPAPAPSGSAPVPSGPAPSGSAPAVSTPAASTPASGSAPASGSTKTSGSTSATSSSSTGNSGSVFNGASNNGVSFIAATVAAVAVAVSFA